MIAGYLNFLVSSKSKIASLDNHENATITKARISLSDPSIDSNTVVTREISEQPSSSGACYTITSNENILRILTEIDAGRLLSKDDASRWKRGHPYHPNNSEVFKVRRYLYINGPQDGEDLKSALRSIPEKLIDSILYELCEQGIVTVKN